MDRGQTLCDEFGKGVTNERPRLLDGAAMFPAFERGDGPGRMRCLQRIP